jgi:hypothetical protein
VAGRAHAHRHVLAEADAEALLAHREQAWPVWRDVAVGAGEALDENVLRIAVRRRHATGDRMVPTEHEEGNARREGTGERKPRRLDASEVPLDRLREGKMRIVGEQRLAG